MSNQYSGEGVRCDWVVNEPGRSVTATFNIFLLLKVP